MIKEKLKGKKRSGEDIRRKKKEEKKHEKTKRRDAREAITKLNSADAGTARRSRGMEEREGKHAAVVEEEEEEERQQKGNRIRERD